MGLTHAAGSALEGPLWSWSQVMKTRLEADEVAAQLERCDKENKILKDEMNKEIEAVLLLPSLLSPLPIWCSSVTVPVSALPVPWLPAWDDKEELALLSAPPRLCSPPPFLFLPTSYPSLPDILPSPLPHLWMWGMKPFVMLGIKPRSLYMLSVQCHQAGPQLPFP